MLVLGGRLANLFERGSVTVSGSEAVAAFPKANLWDGEPGNSFAFQTNTASRYLIVDGDLALGTGAFDEANGVVPTSWTAVNVAPGTAVCDDGLGSPQGANSLLLNSYNGGASGRAGLRKDFLCRAGETLNIHFYLHGDIAGEGGAGEVTTVCEIQDLETGQYLAGTNVWQDTQIHYASRVVQSWGETTSAFQVSPMSYWPAPVRRIRVEFRTPNTGVAQGKGRVDDFYLVPSWDFFSIHGHNIRKAAIDVVLQGSADLAFTSPTTHATLVPVRDKFWTRLQVPCASRFTKVLFSGTNTDEPIWIGELLLGLCEQFTRTAAAPFISSAVDVRVDIPTSLGGFYTVALAVSPQHSKSLVFQFADAVTDADSGLWKQFYNELLLRNMGGYPLALVATEAYVEVLYCKMTPQLQDADGSPGAPGYRVVQAVTFVELPLPVTVP